MASDIDRMTNILTRHQETPTGGCFCGWEDSESAFSRHLAEAILASGLKFTKVTPPKLPAVDRRPLNDFGLKPILVRSIANETTARAVRLTKDNMSWVASWVNHQQTTEKRSAKAERDGLRMVIGHGHGVHKLVFGVAQQGDWIVNWGHGGFETLTDETFRETFKAD